MKLEQPNYDEVLASGNALLARVATLEMALTKISNLSVAGTWPSWEMGMIARDALGPTYEKKHKADLTREIQAAGY